MTTKHKQATIAMLIGLVLMVLIGGIYFVAQRRAQAEAQAAWDEFSAQHDCRVTLKVEPNFRRSGATGYLCDDGVTYWRGNQE